MTEIAINGFEVYRSLVNLDYLSPRIDQEGSRQTEIAVTVKKIAIENVVNAGHIVRSHKDWK